MSLIQKFFCGDLVGNRYSLDILVHEGRWGDIFRATDRLNDRPVAIRFFPNGGGGPADSQRFLAHARDLSSLTEPIIAKPLDHGVADGICYVVYRWAKGQNLEETLAERGRLKLAEALTVLEQLLEGLSSVHQTRLTHGLLRPVKIVISGLDEEAPMVRLVDLQIWRFFEWSSGQQAFDTSNLSRRIVRYLAPEVIEEHRVYPQSDLYGVGLITIEMLTGKPAFDANHRVALIAHQLSEEPATLSADVEAGPAFRDFLARLTAKNKADRFPTAAAALKALRQGRAKFLAQPVSPAPQAQDHQESDEQAPEPWATVEPEDGPEEAEIDPSIVENIPQGTGEDVRLQAVDDHLRTTIVDPSPAPPPRRPATPMEQNSQMSTPVTLLLSLALLALLGGAAYFLFTDDGDTPDLAEEVADTTEAAPSFELTITTHPPAQTVLVEGRPRGISPLTVEISEDELPLAVRARTDRENVHEATVTQAQSDLHFDLVQ